MNDNYAVKNGTIIDNNTPRTKEIDQLIYLLSCAVNETKPDAKYVENMDLDDVYHLALFHSVVSLTAFALEELITLPRKFDQAKKKQLERLLCLIMKGVGFTLNFPKKRFGICR